MYIPTKEELEEFMYYDGVYVLGLGNSEPFYNSSISYIGSQWILHTSDNNQDDSIETVLSIESYTDIENLIRIFTPNEYIYEPNQMEGTQ